MTTEEFTAFLNEAKELEARSQRLQGQRTQQLAQLKKDHGVETLEQAQDLLTRKTEELERLKVECERKITALRDKLKRKGVL